MIKFFYLDNRKSNKSLLLDKIVITETTSVLFERIKLPNSLLLTVDYRKIKRKFNWFFFFVTNWKMTDRYCFGGVLVSLRVVLLCASSLVAFRAFSWCFAAQLLHILHVKRYIVFAIPWYCTQSHTLSVCLLSINRLACLNSESTFIIICLPCKWL